MLLALPVWAKPLEILTLEFAPYAYAENGQAKGFVTEIVREAFRRMDQPIEIKVLPWARCLLYMEFGKADATFPMFRTAERETYTDYTSEPLIYEYKSLFVHHTSDISYSGNFDDLKHYTFGKVSEFGSGPIFDQAEKEGLKVDLTSSAEQNVLKLINQRFDILVDDKYVIMAILQRMGQQEQLRYIGDLEAVPSYLGFSKLRNHQELLKKFEQTLTEMKADGTYQRIIKKNFLGLEPGK